MKYIVINNFIDLEDRHNYHKGDKFPKKGTVKPERAKELTGSNNKAGYPLIKEVG